MAESVPLVRLTKDGLWAVCSRVECGERFAMRVEASDAQWAKRVDTEVDRANRPRKATLDFLAAGCGAGAPGRSKGGRIRLSQGRQPVKHLGEPRATSGRRAPRGRALDPRR